MIIFSSVVFLFGMIIGSFINVCIYRIPRDESIWHPRSHCPKCGRLIHWYDNIPILSFVLLRGRCRSCGHKISQKYPFVELLTGLSFFLLAEKYAFQISLPIYLYFTFVLITISGIDFSSRIIPDVFSFSLIIVGLLFSPFNIQLAPSWHMRLINSAIGGVTGFVLLFFISYAGGKIMRQEVMGGGDIKLLAGIGAILGVHKTISTLFIAALIGSAAGIFLMINKKMNRKEYMPFGPFLAAGSYINLFLPDDIFRLWTQ